MFNYVIGKKINFKKNKKKPKSIRINLQIM